MKKVYLVIKVDGVDLYSNLLKACNKYELNYSNVSGSIRRKGWWGNGVITIRREDVL